MTIGQEEKNSQNTTATITSHNKVKDEETAKRRVLVVDDEEDILTVIQRQLSRWYEVDTFSNAEEAIEHIKKMQSNESNNDISTGPSYWNVIVSDIRMPVMNGFEFVRQVMPLLPSAKIIFMTAFEINKSEFGIMHPSIRADDFISKPFSTELLCKVIERQLTVNSNR